MKHAATGALQEIAKVVGEASAVIIAAQVGGRIVYIPAKASDRHWLVESVGREKADMICRHFCTERRGQYVYIALAGGGSYPQLRRVIAKRFHELSQEKASASKIAREVGLTMRTVHRHRARRRGNPNQGKLF